MVKITLYNSGGYIKRSKFFIVLWASFYCIPDIIKISARHIFGRKNTSASMLWVYKNKNRITLRALALNKHIISEACQLRCVCFYIDTQHSIWSNVLWLRRYSCSKKNIYIMYIYINSTLVSTIHKKNKIKYMWRTEMFVLPKRKLFIYFYKKVLDTILSLY